MNNLVVDYERLVYSIINKYKGFAEVDDLYQVGMIGLLKAVDNYDSGYDTKFSTYAHTYILGEVLKYIRDNKLIKINRDLIKLNRSVEELKSRLSQKYSREVSNDDVALILGVDVSLINEAEISNDFIRSLDFELGEDKDLSFYNNYGYEEVGYSSDIIDLRSEIDSLDDDEKRLIQYRYFDDITQSEASRKMGISQVQVSRCEKKILKKLRDRLS